MIAKLSDGRTIEYHPKMIGEGATKQAYFTKDGQSVICFYKNSNLSLTRLQKILTVFNPTITDKYWQELFCWPTNIVVEPKLGVIVPTYPPNFFFATGRWQGKAKKSRWFISPKLRNYLPITEQGSWLDYFKIGILLARAINRLHLSGLAHSDLSDNNILLDPSTGKVLITDLDTLVVPQIFAPEVNGTPNYIQQQFHEYANLSRHYSLGLNENPILNLPANTLLRWTYRSYLWKTCRCFMEPFTI